MLDFEKKILHVVVTRVGTRAKTKASLRILELR